MGATATGILALFLLGCALLGPMILLRRREELFLDRLEAHVRSLGHPSANRIAVPRFTPAGKQALRPQRNRASASGSSRH